MAGRNGVIGQITSILQNAGSSAQRVAELLPHPDNASPVPPSPAEFAAALAGPLRFEGVSFQYDRRPSLQMESESKCDRRSGWVRAR